MTKDEMKNRISMALTDPTLQQGFEIICKDLAELEKENAKAKDLLMNLSTCLEGHSNNNFEFELLKETEEFLEEKSK